MKKSLSTLIIIIVLCLASCNFMHDWPDDGLYFMRWESYHAYSIGEFPYLQLAILAVHADNKKLELPEITEISLISDKGELPSTDFNVDISNTQKDYAMITIGVSLDDLPQNEYTITGVRLVDNSGISNTYDIGTWFVQVSNEYSDSDLAYGKKTFYSSAFDMYTIEIINNTDSVIDISDLEFDIPNKQYSVQIKSSPSYDHIFDSNDMSIQPYSMRSFEFTYISNNMDVPSFSSLRPVLVYKINNVEKRTVLPTTIYSMVPKENEIKELAYELLQ